MAAPSYTTDLAIFTNGSSLTGFVEFTGYTSGTKQVIDPDLAIYGTSCISASNRAASPCSLGFDLNEPAGWTSGDSFFVWQKFFAPNAVDVFANKGIVVCIGNTSANFYEYKEDGSDTYPYGGWVNYAVNPLITTNRTTVGSPSGVWDVCGMGWSMINGIAKGNALTVDIIRWGRGESIFTDGDLGNGYATFDGYALVNDNPTTGRFGLIQDIGGAYLWKGLMSLGTSGTSVDFRDSNVNISIDDTLNVAADFNRIEVNNAGSNIEWIGINITKVGTVSNGEFEMIDNATVDKTGCTFTDMSTFTYLSNATILTSTYRRCGLITQGGSTITSALIDSSSDTAKAILSDDPELITDSNFISDGTGHAIECATTGTYNWTDNTDEGYSGTRGSNLTPASGSVNDMFYNSSGGLITLNVSGGQSPSVRNSAGSTTVVVNSVSLIIAGIKTESEVRIINLDDVENYNKELHGVESINGSVLGVDVFDGGTGYAVNDVLTVVGGTGTAATITVDAISGGVVTAVSVTTAGDYSVAPVNPVTTTVAPAGGTGCKLTLNVTGSTSYAYDASFNPKVAVIVFHLDFKEVRIEFNLTATSQTIPIQQTTDRVYHNP